MHDAYRYGQRSQILLLLRAFVGGQQYVELVVCERNKFAVPDAGPAPALNGDDRVPMKAGVPPRILGSEMTRGDVRAGFVLVYRPDEVLERMLTGMVAITLPKLPGYGPSGEAAVTRVLELCRERIASFA